MSMNKLVFSYATRANWKRVTSLAPHLMMRGEDRLVKSREYEAGADKGFDGVN